MENYDLDELRDKLRDYYGTATVVMSEMTPYGFLSPLNELLQVDEMSDEDVLAKAREFGLI